jgi:hypothetical protein
MNTTYRKTIEVTVSPTGETKVETKGFTGPACRDASKFIESALGKTTQEKLTAEFHQTVSSEQQACQQS